MATIAPPQSALPPAPRPQVPPPGKRLAERCWQGETWVTHAGAELTLADMEDSHVWNVLGYLRFYAPELRKQTPAKLRASKLDLRTWLAQLPMWRALSLELWRRELVGDPDRVLSELEAQSVTPWQSA